MYTSNPSSTRLLSLARLVSRRREMATLAAHPASTQSFYSFASPESDFTGARPLHQQQTKHEMSTLVWSRAYSFATPEADFTAGTVNAAAAATTVDTNADTAASVLSSHSHQPSWSFTLSFASPESDFCGSAHPLPSTPLDLPRTLAAALLETDRAIVVTAATAPHRILHVNRAWEDLCGYRRDQVLHQTLRVIQGPATNPQLVLRAVENVLSSPEQSRQEDVYVVNYKQNGRAFINHLSLGALVLEAGNQTVDYLVGVLEEVHPSQVPLRLVNA